MACGWAGRRQPGGLAARIASGPARSDTAEGGATGFTFARDDVFRSEICPITGLRLRHSGLDGYSGPSE